MRKNQVPSDLIYKILKISLKLEGAKDLMVLYLNEDDKTEEDLIINDLKDLIKAYGRV